MAWLDVPLLRGKTVKQRVPVGHFSDGSPILLPVATIAGKRDGPVVFVQAGIHGDEVTGIEIARRLINNEVNPLELNGSLVIIPVANIPAYLTRTRGYLVEERGPIDINRIFPGHSKGLLTERIARILFDEFIMQSDVTINICSALDGADIVPFTYVMPDDDENGTLQMRKRIAHAFGFPYVYYKSRGKEFGTSDFSKTVSLQADLAGKPLVDVELGESRIVKQESVPLGLVGFKRALQAAGLLAGSPESATTQRSFSDFTLVHANLGGGLKLKVGLGDDVQKGQELGHIEDIFGEPIEQLICPVSGFVMRVMRFANISTGAEALWIGH